MRASRASGRATRIQSRLKSTAAREADAKQATVACRNLLVHAVRQEDEEALKRRDDREHEEEDSRSDVVRNDVHQVAENPRQTNRDEDREVDAEFLLTVALIALWCAGQRLVNLAANEEEQNGIRRQDDEARQEEGQEASQIADNVAICVAIAIIRQPAI